MGEFGPQLNRITRWSEQMSGGRFRYQFQTTDDWVSVPVASADYVVGAPLQNAPDQDRTAQNALVEAILEAAGSRFDYSKADGVIFHFPASVQGLERDLGGRGMRVNTPTGQRTYFFWGGGSYHHTSTRNSPHYPELTSEMKRSKFWAYWIHEMLHSQGLALHAPGNGFATGLGQDNYGPSQAISAWEQFLLGWLGDDQVYCADRNSLTTASVILTPQEVQGGERQVAIVRVGQSEALVIESRRPIGVSAEWPADMRGIFVYRVDTRFDNDRSGESFGDSGNDPTYSKWSYYLPPDGSRPRNSQTHGAYDHLVRQGGSVTANGVKITLEFSDQRDYVRLERL